MILQASSGGAWRSLAALIALPLFSASSRNGTKPFMQASEGPPPAWVGGAGAKPLGAATGAAPALGNGEAPGGGAPTEALGAAPFTGGNAGSLAGARWAAPLTGGNAGSFAITPPRGCWFGNGAGNAPCASACPPWTASTAIVIGTIRRWIIKSVSPASSKGPFEGLQGSRISGVRKQYPVRS